jgi:hypothetical protein
MSETKSSESVGEGVAAVLWVGLKGAGRLGERDDASTAGVSEANDEERAQKSKIFGIQRELRSRATASRSRRDGQGLSTGSSCDTRSNSPDDDNSDNENSDDDNRAARNESDPAVLDQ